MVLVGALRFGSVQDYRCHVEVVAGNYWARSYAWGSLFSRPRFPSFVRKIKTCCLLLNTNSWYGSDEHVQIRSTRVRVYCQSVTQSIRWADRTADRTSMCVSGNRYETGGKKWIMNKFATKHCRCFTWSVCGAYNVYSVHKLWTVWISKHYLNNFLTTGLLGVWFFVVIIKSNLRLFGKPSQNFLRNRYRFVSWATNWPQRSVGASELVVLDMWCRAN